MTRFIIFKNKNRLFFLLILLFILLAAVNLWAQEEKIDYEKYVYETKEVEIQYFKINGPCLIYENDLALIKCKKDDIFGLFKRVTTIVNKPSVDALKNKIESFSINEYRLEMFDKYEQGRLRVIMEILLAQGKVLLKEKATNDIIKKIEVGFYNYYREPLWGKKGKIFKLPSKKIFYNDVEIYY